MIAIIDAICQIRYCTLILGHLIRSTKQIFETGIHSYVAGQLTGAVFLSICTPISIKTTAFLKQITEI